MITIGIANRLEEQSRGLLLVIEIAKQSMKTMCCCIGIVCRSVWKPCAGENGISVPFDRNMQAVTDVEVV